MTALTGPRLRPLLSALLVLAVVLLPGLARALPGVSSFTLDNGLEVIVVEDPRSPAVTQMIWYRVGAADEQPGKSGIAHFLEHLMFKGTEALPAGEFSRIVRANGGRDNAFTSWDYTAYFQTVAADRLGLIMEMEADRMTGLVLPPEEVETERDVVLAERGQVVESRPGSLFSEQRRAMQFLNHPYGRPIIGWRHEIEGLTRQDALDFYAAHYSPDNAFLVIAGGVTVEEVRALAETHYGPIPHSGLERARLRPSEPPQIAPRRLSMEDERVARPYVLRTYLTEPRRSGAQREAAALALLAELLGGDPATSYLGRSLVRGAGVALGVSAFYDSEAVDASTFGLYIAPVDGVSLAEAEAALDRAVAAFLEEGPRAEDMARVLTQVRANLIYEQDNAAGRARRIGFARASGLTLEDIAAWPDLLAEITAEEIVAAGRAVFDPRRSVTGWLSDGSENAAAPAEELSQ